MPAPARTPPKVFISYSRDSPEHMDRVLQLADRLRADGIDAEIDQYESAVPEGLQVWMERQIRESDFVLVVCTETYRKRVEHKEDPGKGHGVMWEINLIFGEIYRAGSKNEKVIAVLLEGCGSECIPAPLQPWPYYDCSNEKGYLELYRRLTSQPEITKPELGDFKSLPQRKRQPVTQRSAGGKPWNVPQDRNPVFTGREEILQELRADLVKNGRQALSAMGGMGKTQIAVEYAWRHREDYQAVLWTFADGEQSVSSGFARMAALLSLPEKDSTEQAAITAAVRRWLEEHDGWLLVFDNADQPGLLRPFLPQPQRGHVLLTSRNQVFQSIGIIKPREVSVLAPQAAREFLLKRTGQDATKKSPEADALARELGYYPLALEQAGAYMTENQASFAAYLAGFKERRLKLFEKQKAAIGDYKETVTTTWALNFEEIEKNSPASADLLRLSAFLAPDAVPLELLEKGKDEMGERVSASLADSADDPLALVELLKPLTNYSLIRPDQQKHSYSIHLMVQEVLRSRMTPEEQKTWAERAVGAVSAALPGIEFQTWPDYERLLAHAIVCSNWIDSFGLEFADAARLMNQASYYLRERAQYSEAEPLLRRALAIAEKALGPKHRNTATSLNNLAVLYDNQGKYEQAEPLYQRAVRIDEKALGLEHPETATDLNNLAELYRKQGKYDQAEPLYERALAIREKALGPEHPDTANSINCLAVFYHDQAKYEQVERLYERALAIREKTLGPEHPNTATSLNNLAFLYKEEKKYKQAEPLGWRALNIAERALGPEHPSTILCARNLIAIYRDQGKQAEAEALERRFPKPSKGTEGR